MRMSRFIVRKEEIKELETMKGIKASSKGVEYSMCGIFYSMCRIFLSFQLQHKTVALEIRKLQRYVD